MSTSAMRFMNLLLSACGRCGASGRKDARTVDEWSRGALACHSALNDVRHPAGDADVTGLVHVMDASSRRGDRDKGKDAANGGSTGRPPMSLRRPALG